MKLPAMVTIALLAALSLSACDDGSCQADGSSVSPVSNPMKGGGGGGGHGSSGGGHASSGGGAHEGTTGGTVPVIPHVFPGNGGHACTKGA